jgi:hypothetical protein
LCPSWPSPSPPQHSPATPPSLSPCVAAHIFPTKQGVQPTWQFSAGQPRWIQQLIRRRTLRVLRRIVPLLGVCRIRDIRGVARRWVEFHWSFWGRREKGKMREES